MDSVETANLVLFDRFRWSGPGSGLLRQDDTGVWTPVAVGSRALEVLAVLVDRQGELLAKDEIMRRVWPGTTVEEKNLTVQMSALRRVLDEGRGGESCIQTVPGRGYRFLPAVTRSEATTAAGIGPSPRAPSRLRLRWQSTALGSTLCIGITLALLWPPGWGAAVAPRMSVVVRPFEDLDVSPAQDGLAQAITEDVSIALSRSTGVRMLEPRGAALARYELHGSVRRQGGALRVTTRLVSAQTGVHLWASTVDEVAGEPEIGQRIGRAAYVALADAESARTRSERPTALEAEDLILRTRSIGLHPMGVRERAERTRLYEQAIQLEPRSIVALTGLSLALIRRSRTGEGNDLVRAIALQGDAEAIDPHHPNVQNLRANLLMAQGRFAEAIAAYGNMLREYPDLYGVYGDLADCLTNVGRADEAVSVIEWSLGKDPNASYVPSSYRSLGFALLMLGRDAESIAWTERALAGNPGAAAETRSDLTVRLAAAHARLGHPEDARRAVAEANRLWPYDTARKHYPDDPTSKVYAEQISRYQDGLRLAGLRDHADEDADAGIVADQRVHDELAGPTPTTAPGATTIHTAELQRLMAEQRPVVIDSMLYSWGRSVPGAVGLTRAGWPSRDPGVIQDRLRWALHGLTGGDLDRPVVAVGYNSERFDGRNLALRLAALGYRNVYWYRGGREAWEVAGLPEMPVEPVEW